MGELAWQRHDLGKANQMASTGVKWGADKVPPVNRPALKKEPGMRGSHCKGFEPYLGILEQGERVEAWEWRKSAAMDTSAPHTGTL